MSLFLVVNLNYPCKRIGGKTKVLTEIIKSSWTIYLTLTLVKVQPNLSKD